MDQEKYVFFAADGWIIQRHSVQEINQKPNKKTKINIIPDRGSNISFK